MRKVIERKSFFTKCVYEEVKRYVEINFLKEIIEYGSVDSKVDNEYRISKIFKRLSMHMILYTR